MLSDFKYEILDQDMSHHGRVLVRITAPDGRTAYVSDYGKRPETVLETAKGLTLVQLEPTLR